MPDLLHDDIGHLLRAERDGGLGLGGVAGVLKIAHKWKKKEHDHEDYLLRFTGPLCSVCCQNF